MTTNYEQAVVKFLKACNAAEKAFADGADNMTKYKAAITKAKNKMHDAEIASGLSDDEALKIFRKLNSEIKD